MNDINDSSVNSVSDFDPDSSVRSYDIFYLNICKDLTKSEYEGF